MAKEVVEIGPKTAKLLRPSEIEGLLRGLRKRGLEVTIIGQQVVIEGKNEERVRSLADEVRHLDRVNG